MKIQLKKTALITTIAATVITITGCASTAQSSLNTSHQPSLNSKNTYPVAAVLKQAAMNGFDEMLVADDAGLMGSEGFEMSIRAIIEPIDLDNQKLVEFKGHQLLESDTVSIFFFDGIPLMTEQSKTYYLPNSLVSAGTVIDGEDNFSIFTKQYPIPVNANIGDAGKLTEGYDLGMSDDGSKTLFTDTWQLKKASGDNAKLCVYEKFEELAEGSTCYTINKQGDILQTHLKYTLSIEDGEPPVTFVSK